MIAEACKMFGWTPDVILKMPVRRFFSIVKSGRLLETLDRLEDCDIAAISIANSKYYEYVKDIFRGRLLESNEETKIEGPKYSPLTEEEQKETRINVAKVLAIKKRELGYGK